MLVAEFAVQGAETTRGAQKEKVLARNGSSAPQTNVDIVMTKDLVAEVSYSRSDRRLP
jgi:hypothetical protein